MMTDSKIIVDTIQFGTAEELAALFSYRDFEADMDLGAEFDHDTPIHIAAYYKQLAHLKFLIDSLPAEKRKKALNALNAEKATPLHEVCYTCLPAELFQEENPNASGLVVSKQQREYERQCLMMPLVMTYLIEQGADSFYKKMIISGKKMTVLKLISFLKTLEEPNSEAFRALTLAKEKIAVYQSQKSLLKRMFKRWIK